MCYTPCHDEEADRLTKHLLPMHAVEAIDSSTPLRSAQNDSALRPLILKSHMTFYKIKQQMLADFLKTTI